MPAAAGRLLGSCEGNVGADDYGDVFRRACQSLTRLTLHFKPPETVSAFIPPGGRQSETRGCVLWGNANSPAGSLSW